MYVPTVTGRAYNIYDRPTPQRNNPARKVDARQFRILPAAMKRKRTSGYGQRKTKSFKKGYDRTSGYYGRFAQGSGELKFHDRDVDDSPMAVGGSVSTSWNLIPQGVTEATRVGRKCTIKSIAWRYNLRLIATVEGDDDAYSDEVRLIVFLDKQCNGAMPTATDILAADDYQAFNNLANSQRFRILYDKVHCLDHPSGGGLYNVSEKFRWGEQMISDAFYKKVNIPLEFSSTTGAITEIRSNNIGLLTVTKAGKVYLDSKVRLRFSDGQ